MKSLAVLENAPLVKDPVNNAKPNQIKAKTNKQTNSSWGLLHWFLPSIASNLLLIVMP
jgi:hypothetical protein